MDAGEEEKEVGELTSALANLRIPSAAEKALAANPELAAPGAAGAGVVTAAQGAPTTTSRKASVAALSEKERQMCAQLAVLLRLRAAIGLAAAQQQGAGVA